MSGADSMKLQTLESIPKYSKGRAPETDDRNRKITGNSAPTDSPSQLPESSSSKNAPGNLRLPGAFFDELDSGLEVVTISDKDCMLIRLKLHFRCRQKKEEELKILREENPALREENARLRQVVDTLEKRKLNGSDSVTTNIGTIKILKVDL